MLTADQLNVLADSIVRRQPKGKRLMDESVTTTLTFDETTIVLAALRTSARSLLNGKIERVTLGTEHKDV